MTTSDIAAHWARQDVCEHPGDSMQHPDSNDSDAAGDMPSDTGEPHTAPTSSPLGTPR